MDYVKLEKFLSKPRLDKFLIATQHSRAKALELYQINVNISRCCYPLLHMLEVMLRNSVYQNIAAHFGDSDWIINEKYRYMSDQSLAATGFYLRRSVEAAEAQIIRTYGTINAERVLSQQSFGFWTRQFEAAHYRLIGGCVISCFPLRPSWANRTIIISRLNHIREFRNRVYHNEPICFSGYHINFDRLTKARTAIYELLQWMDHDLEIYVRCFDQIESGIDQVNFL